jgi:3',5'-cyclic AMP phosphodiesterase CpdA
MRPWLRYLCCAIPGFALAAVLALRPSPPQETEEPVRLDPAFRAPARLATGFPDRVILTWKGDPAHSQAVTWRTDTTVRRPKGEIAVAGDGPHFDEVRHTVPGTTMRLETNVGPAIYHSVDFTGLRPATRYAYRVGDGERWSEWFQFRTASDHPAPFTFIYFGDVQNQIRSLWSRVVRQAYSDAPHARFILHAGDLIADAETDSLWGEWFGAPGWINAMVPDVPSPGNHDYVGPTDGRHLGRYWRAQFALPENGPRGLKETTYYLDFQGTRIISLNSNERLEEQAEWLEPVLRQNPNRWTVITFHHPIYSSAKGRDNARLRQLWQPIFARYHVDLVLQGHDHTYARSGAGGDNAPAGNGGTVYVVSVSGAKMYQLDRKAWMRRAAEDTQLYQVISIENDRLSYQSRTATGDLYDAFELRKREGQINALIELMSPDARERRRAAALLSARF